ncbi:hypothetical protein EKO23_08730 [Nocardioides guangzhouensis]|uniref:DUF2157 domain-containing protein n=1 Tax=Nocardioides guangzhouensis TaxID=2497878 RepID=A0A4Q4ZH20_9ACTN|nr:hypothetical protein [Nocardioides guangzhouensis]RYP86736.1 hypothetical protein EKO23_08730 [Nocardioides guangzhouensis]
MIRYADPEVCPCCRQAITYAATQCRHCDATLTGPDAEALFRTLTHADSLVARLAAAAVAVAQPVAHPAAQPVAQPVGQPVAQPVAAGVAASATGPAPATAPRIDVTALPAYPTSASRERSTGLGAASVPRILLGLGATCLLAAAIVFLVVAWGDLGFGTRTVILLALTSGAGAATGWMARRGLPAGAESFGLLLLGFLVLDLLGALSAGWLDAVSSTGFVALVGSVLGVVGSATAAAVGRTSLRPLVGAQLVAIAGTALAAAAVTDLAGTAEALALTILVLALAAVAALSHAAGLRVAAAGATLLCGIWWLLLVALGLGRVLDDPSFADVWLRIEGWPLLAAAGLAAAPALVRAAPEALRVSAASIGVAVLVVLTVAPVVDESTVPVVLTGLAVVAGAGVASYLLPGRWQWVLVAPALAAGTGLGLWVLAEGGRGLETLLELGVWTLGAGDRVGGGPTPATWLVLLPAAAAAAVAALAVSLRPAGGPGRRGLTDLAVVAVGGTVAVLPGLYDVPLGSALAVQVAVVVALATAGLRATPVLHGVPVTLPAAGAAAVSVLAAVTAVGNDVTTAALLTLLTAAAGWASFRGRDGVRVVGDVALAPVAGALVWTLLHLAGGDLVWRAVPVVVLAGLLAIVRPTFARELGGTLAVLVAVPVSVLSGTGVDQTWLAVYLTLAGALVMVSALRNPDRTELGWTGLGLLTLAQWVRLEQLGVGTVEAYTLPLALVLIGVGLVRMRDTAVSSRRALSAGLGLALGPSLLLVLVEPVTIRAFWLGLACLVLVVAGVLLRWATPLVAGAAVGLVLVLREAQYASVAPQWVLIGLVGTVLTVVGVTWEQRLADLRKAAAYVRRLR